MTESIASRPDTTVTDTAKVRAAADPAGPGALVLIRDERVLWIPLVAESARSLGLSPILVTTPLPGRERAIVEPAVDRLVEVDTLADPEMIARHVQAIAADVNVVGVMTVPDGMLVPVAEATTSLDLARCPASAIATARNKHAARLAMRAAGVPVPRFGLLSSDADASAVAEAVGLPAVIKPVNGSGSTLVRPVTSVEELAEAYRLVAERFPTESHYARSISLPDGSNIDPCRTFLVEGRLSGREYSVDVIVRDGAVEAMPVVDKALLDERYFELGFVCPPFDLPEGRVNAIAAAAVDAVQAVGLDNCVSHVEVIDDADRGPVVVEVNAGRPGGQLLPLLHELTAGADLFAESVSLATGTPPPPRAPVTPGVQLATLTIFAPSSGRLSAIHGLDEVAELPEVLKVIPGVTVGDVLSEDVETYAVNLLVGGFLDVQDLRAIYDEAAALVRLELEPLPDSH